MLWILSLHYVSEDLVQKYGKYSKIISICSQNDNYN